MSSPLPPTQLFAPPELVMAAWISSIPGFVADSVGPTLPPDDTTWREHGAVTMFVVGGTEDPYVAISKTVLQVETWTCNPGSNKPEWLASWNLARQIRVACLDRVNTPRALSILSPGGAIYPGASIRAVTQLSAARRAYGSKADYAGHIFDLVMTWTQNGLVTR